MNAIINESTYFLRNYAEKYDRKWFVVGVSGGIDSALVSTLCARTGFPVICVVLPCHSKTDQTERGNRHIEWLKKQFPKTYRVKIDLTNTFNAFKSVVPFAYHTDLGFANSKSRLRMIALYQVAAAVGGLVVGTGNKVEDFGVGFFTKYGDGGVDISPIADFTKTEVRQCAKELGINEEIITTAPTDGLWDDGRTDEQALKASYEELEWAMDYVGKTPAEQVAFGILTNRQQEVLKIYNKLHDATKHKLEPIPTFKRK